MKCYLLIVFFALFALDVFGSKIKPPDKVAISKSATNIFIGRVVATIKREENGRCETQNIIAKIAVIENIRGNAPKTIALPVCNGSKGFNLQLARNGLYIFFLLETKDGFSRVYPAGGIVSF